METVLVRPEEELPVLVQRPDGESQRGFTLGFSSASCGEFTALYSDVLTPFCFWLIAADVLLLSPVGGESRGVHPPVRLHHRTGQTVQEETVRRVCCRLRSRKRDRKITPTSLVVKQSNISHARTSPPIFSSLAVIS